MYHIKNDKRTLVSATLLYDGLLAVLKRKPFQKISVSDLQRESTVSRATFYRLFDNVIDILAWKCDEDYKKVFAECILEMENQGSKYSCIETYFRSWSERAELLEVLIGIHRTDIVFNSFIDNYHIITDNYSNVKEFTDNPRLFSAFRSGVAFAALIYWVESGKKETPAEIMKYLTSQLRFATERELFF